MTKDDVEQEIELEEAHEDQDQDDFEVDELDDDYDEDEDEDDIDIDIDDGYGNGQFLSEDEDEDEEGWEDDDGGDKDEKELQASVEKEDNKNRHSFEEDARFKFYVDALKDWNKRTKENYYDPIEHVGFVGELVTRHFKEPSKRPAGMEVHDGGFVFLPNQDDYQPFYDNMMGMDIPGATFYQALVALFQLRDRLSKPFRLDRMYSSNLGWFDHYFDLIQFFQKNAVDIAGFESFPSGCNNDDDETYLEEAIATARAIHYYIRFNTIVMGQLKLDCSKNMRILETARDHGGAEWYETEEWLDEAKEKLGTEHTSVQSWQSWLGPNQIGLGINNAMSNLCFDRSQKKWRYDLGDWVEIRNYKMKWRLTQVTERVVRKKEDGTAIFYYGTNTDWGGISDNNPDSRRNLFTAINKAPQNERGEEEEKNEGPAIPQIEGGSIKIRLPQEAVCRIFGIGPWIWQRWALLQLELVLRFSEDDHRNDFENLDIITYASELWLAWVKHPQNKAFRRVYDVAGPSGQEELLRHVMDPFTTMNEVLNDADTWSFDDERISVFMYTAILGSGFCDALIVIMLQVLIPSTLLLVYLEAQDGEEQPVGTRLMLFLALAYYVQKVASDLQSSFRDMMSSQENTYSQLLAIRRLAWDGAFETGWQSFGYILECTMNAGYVALLYAFNIFILFNSNDSFDILGNLIFFEFVFNLDEQLAASEWFDGDRRYLKAGIIETIIATNFRGAENKSVDFFVEHYEDFVGNDKYGKNYLMTVRRNIQDILKQKPVKRRYNGGTFLFQPGAQETLQPQDPLLPTSRRVRFDIEEFPSTPGKNTQFRAFSNMIPDWLKDKIPFFNVREDRIFEKHCHYRCWDLWSQVLFAAPPLNQRAKGPGGKAPPVVVKIESSGQNASETVYDCDSFVGSVEIPKVDDLTLEAFPYKKNGPGPILYQGFKSPGWCLINNYSYDTSSRFSNRHTDYFEGDRDYKKKIRGIQTFRYWIQKIQEFKDPDRWVSLGKGWWRFLFNGFAFVSYILLMIFAVAVCVLAIVSFSPLYCEINLGFSGRDKCEWQL